MIRRIHHVQITVPREAEQAAREFYCGLLGLTEIDKPESLRARGGLWLELDGQQIHIGVEEGVERDTTKAHIAYEVTELASWRAMLLAHGIEVLDSIAIPDHDRFEFRDPFGNRIEFIARR